jgi:hypothetical protein
MNACMGWVSPRKPPSAPLEKVEQRRPRHRIAAVALAARLGRQPQQLPGSESSARAKVPLERGTPGGRAPHAPLPRRRGWRPPLRELWRNRPGAAARCPAHPLSAASAQCSASRRSRPSRGAPATSTWWVNAWRRVQGHSTCGSSAAPDAEPPPGGQRGAATRLRGPRSSKALRHGTSPPPPGALSTKRAQRRSLSMTRGGRAGASPAGRTSNTASASRPRRCSRAATSSGSFCVSGWGGLGWGGVGWGLQQQLTWGQTVTPRQPAPPPLPERPPHPAARACGSTPIESPGPQGSPLPAASSSQCTTSRPQPGEVSSLRQGKGRRGGSARTRSSGRAVACATPNTLLPGPATGSGPCNLHPACPPRPDDARPVRRRRAVRAALVAVRALLQARARELARAHVLGDLHGRRRYFGSVSGLGGLGLRNGVRQVFACRRGNPCAYLGGGRGPPR